MTAHELAILQEQEAHETRVVGEITQQRTIVEIHPEGTCVIRMPSPEARMEVNFIGHRWTLGAIDGYLNGMRKKGKRFTQPCWRFDGAGELDGVRVLEI